MDPIAILIWLLVLAVGVGIACWIVRKTVPAQWQTIALAIVGIIALIVLLQMLGVFPSSSLRGDLD